MGYYNPDYYYQKLLMDSASEIAELKNENKRLIKKVNQLEKDQTKWLQQLIHRIKQYLYVI